MLKLMRSGITMLCWSSVVLAGAAMAAAPKVPAQMQAVYADPSAGPGALKIETVAVPTPSNGQVLVQVYAAGANPVDWGMRRAHQARAGGILGREISGVVVALGPGVTEYKVGDKVIVALQQAGGYAQYAAADTTDMAMKPKKLTFEQAAGIPVIGFTAMRMVIVGEIKKDQRVVVIGAAGGVGSAAVQLAKTTGAHVITVASSRHRDFLKSIGADEIIDYDKESVADKVKNVDAVLNTVAGENNSAIGYLRRGGMLLTSAGTPDPAACMAAGITCISIVRQGPTNGELIKQVSRLADEGKFTVKVEKAFPMTQTGEAFDFGLTGNREGKIIIDVRPDANKI